MGNSNPRNLEANRFEGWLLRRGALLRKTTFSLRRAPLIPLLIIVVVASCAIFAPFVAPRDPVTIDLTNRAAPPFWAEDGSLTNFLGTDRLGRDILSRLIYGARVSLLVAVAAVGVAGIVGVTLGLLAGYFGGWLEKVIMRAVDIMLSMPYILVALVIVAVVGASLMNVILIIALMFWAEYARIIRSEVLKTKVRDFIALAVVAGCGRWRILLRHIFPNVVNSTIVLATLQVGIAILFESSLSFLGVGVPPPTPTWGSMVSDGLNYLSTAPTISVFPGLAIMLTVLAGNFLGDWLRDALDPRMRQI